MANRKWAFLIRVTPGGGNQFERREGRLMHAQHGGEVYLFGVDRREGKWSITELGTGLNYRYCRTLKECEEFLAKTVEDMHTVINNEHLHDAFKLCKAAYNDPKNDGDTALQETARKIWDNYGGVFW